MSQKETYLEAARQIIQSLGLPKQQQNKRSALCLLALLNLHPGKPWSEAESPLMGITPIMTWIRDNYGQNYAPNTRETIRRQTMHQFRDAGIVLYNPDVTAFPNRAVMSRHLGEIAWETEVWVADSPSHLIHFDGQHPRLKHGGFVPSPSGS
ncbi:MAG: BsuBI/PstI family type II restriction endonuclease [Phormidium sp.]